MKLIDFAISMLKKYRAFILYGIFGVLTTIINIVVYTVLYEFCNIPNIPSNVVAWIAAITVAFITNKIWVFESKTTEKRALRREIISFVACRLATGVLDLLIMYLAVDVAHGPAVIFKVISNVIVIIINYFASKLLIFRDSNSLTKSATKSHSSKNRAAILKRLTSHPAFRPLVALLCATIGTLGAVQLLKFLTPNTTAIATSPLLVALVFVLYLYYKKPAQLNRRLRVLAIATTVVLATISIIGGQLEFYNQIFWTLRTPAKIFLVVFLFYPILALVIKQLSLLAPGNFTLRPKKHGLIAFFCILFVTMFVWLIVFPGVYTYDMAAQNELITRGGALGEWSNGDWSVAHWSLSYGFLLAGFLDLGEALFHSHEVGFAIFIFIQAVFMCYVETRLVLFAARLSRRRAVYIGSTIFFCCMPFLLVTALSAAQDVLFAGLFALATLNLFESITDSQYFEHRLNFIKIPLLCFLMCTVRSNGVYCLLILFLLIACLCRRSCRRHLLITVGISIILAFFYNGPFLRLLHIEKTTSIQEILSVPSQQLARVYYQNPSSLSAENLAALGDYYDLDNGQFELYQEHPLIADHTKASLNISATRDNLLQYIALWTTTGLKNPDLYTEAFLLNSFGYWYPSKNYNDLRLDFSIMNYPGYAMTAAFYDREQHPDMKSIERHSLFPELATKLDGFIFGANWQKIPIFAVFCAMGTYMLLLIFVSGYLIAKRFTTLVMPLGLAIGLFLTLLLSPVAIFRYGYPIVLLAPVIVSLVFISDGEYRTYTAQKAAGASSSSRSKLNS